MHIVFIYNNKYVSVLNVYQYFFVQEKSNINQDKIASINTLFLI